MNPEQEKMDRICQNCGRRYGNHNGNYNCPDGYGGYSKTTSFKEKGKEPMKYRIVKEINFESVFEARPCSGEFKKAAAKFGTHHTIQERDLENMPYQWLDWLEEKGFINNNYTVDMGDTFQIDGEVYIAARVVTNGVNCLGLVSIHGNRWSSGYVSKDELRKGERGSFEELIRQTNNVDEIYSTRNFYKITYEKN